MKKRPPLKRREQGVNELTKAITNRVRDVNASQTQGRVEYGIVVRKQPLAVKLASSNLILSEDHLTISADVYASEPELGETIPVAQMSDGDWVTLGLLTKRKSAQPVMDNGQGTKKSASSSGRSSSREDPYGGNRLSVDTKRIATREYADETARQRAEEQAITAGAGLTKTDSTLDVGQGDGINVTANAVAVDGTVLRDGEAAGGVLSGTYPNPGFAADMATQAELDAVAAAKQDLSDDLTAIAALTTTAHGRGLLDDADAAASRTSLGLDTNYFRAHRSSNISYANGTTFVYNAEDSDAGGIYNNSSGVFTVPVTGHYVLNWTIYYANALTAAQYIQSILVKGGYGGLKAGSICGGQPYNSTEGTAIVYATAGDTFWVNVLHGFGTTPIEFYGTASNPYAVFEGKRVA